MPARWAIANWKMHTTREEAIALASGVVSGLAGSSGWDRAALGVGLAPPYPFLEAVGAAIRGTGMALVAQDCHEQAKGAFTGAVSAPMLASVGVTHVLVGHSERRHHFGDDDARVRAKLEAVLAAGLAPVLCVGERLEEREAGREREVVAGQLRAALSGLPAEARARLVVAYEPVWAIGTGRNATPEQAGAMHRVVQEEVGGLLGGSVPVLYGGSVKPDNVSSLAQTPGVDGVLVGGASLEANAFVTIVRACASEAREGS